MTAETIDLRKRDSTKDSNRLAMDKYKKEENIYFCEQEGVEERPGYKSRTYNKNGSIKGEGDTLNPMQDTGSTIKEANKPHTVEQTAVLKKRQSVIE
eukprot:4659414-Heterocapsa_arctica.AAC.1